MASAVARVVSRLERANIPFMLVGSVAGLVYGHARSTIDADLVIDPSIDALRKFVVGLDEEAFYVSPEAADEALRTRGQFNVIDFESGLKIDLFIRKESRFHHEEFTRRRPTNALGVPVSIASPEDVILSKLRWGADSGSSRQAEDVSALVALLDEGLDWDYLRRWAKELGVQEALAEARKES